MRVLILVHGLGVGGAETMIAALARHLRGAGNEVEIDCLDAIGAIGAELRAEGFRVGAYDRRPGFDATLPLRLAGRMRRGGFDVVHAHQRTAFFYGILAGLLDPTPLVYSEHGPLHPRGPSRRKKAFNRVLGRRARRLTAVSDDLRRSLAAVEGLDAGRIEIVRNAVDLGRFAPPNESAREEARRRVGVSSSAVVIGSVGRLVPVKNHGLLLHVLRRLVERVSNAHLAIVGDGPEHARVELLARALGVADRLSLLGERRDVAALLPAFDVFCLSSLAEGIPLTLLEAMAAGVPIVSTSVGGIPEAAHSEQEALLVGGTPPDCASPLDAAGAVYVDSFAACVERLLQEPARGARLTASAAERVRSEFSMDAVCRRYAEVLAAVAAGR